MCVIVMRSHHHVVVRLIHHAPECVHAERTEMHNVFSSSGVFALASALTSIAAHVKDDINRITGTPLPISLSKCMFWTCNG